MSESFNISAKWYNDEKREWVYYCGTAVADNRMKAVVEATKDAYEFIASCVSINLGSVRNLRAYGSRMPGLLLRGSEDDLVD